MPVHKPTARLLVTLMFSVIATQATAQNIQVVGPGSRKCAEWIEWKDTQNAEARAVTVGWVSGFISGHNLYARAGKLQGNSVTADVKVIATLLDSFCQKNPENRIFLGAIDIVQSLGGAKISLTQQSESPKPAPTNPKPAPQGTREL